MALTYTPAGALNSACPDFALRDVEGHFFRRQDFAQSKALVIMFLCNHCPYVRAIEDRLLNLAREYRAREVGFVAVCANDPSEAPEDSPENLRKNWQAKAYGFPYLIDVTQSTAKAMDAVCTPDLFVFDASHKLRYRGRLDDSWRNSQLVRRRELQLALEQILRGEPVTEAQNPSMGCSIKWKKR